MSVFGAYSEYYDLMYEDKDYASEAAYVMALARQYRPELTFLLDLGCGSGRHAEQIAKSGISVSGVDRSQSMIDLACERRRHLPPEIGNRLNFVQGDLRQIKLKSKFDAIISLFHVLSYQSTNIDVLNAFHVVKEHLNPGGVFLFDCWYGPGVLSCPPEVRVKRWNKASRKVTRIAEPVVNSQENIVDVNYTMLISDLGGSNVRELTETHRMRYFFLPELQLFASHVGLRIVECYEWMSSRRPDASSWNACFVVQQ